MQFSVPEKAKIWSKSRRMPNRRFAKSLITENFFTKKRKKPPKQKKKQVTVTVKEIKFRPATDDHDYGYRMERAREWIGDGDKVRATISFRGREMTHRELGAAILAKLRNDLADIADVEVRPKMEGYQMFLIFVPKKGLAEKKPAPAEKKDE